MPTVSRWLGQWRVPQPSDEVTIVARGGPCRTADLTHGAGPSPEPDVDDEDVQKPCSPWLPHVKGWRKRALRERQLEQQLAQHLEEVHDEPTAFVRTADF